MIVFFEESSQRRVKDEVFLHIDKVHKQLPPKGAALNDALIKKGSWKSSL